MNRLQKKCFMVSAGLHLLLPMILVFGSALTPRSKTAEDMPVLEFIPLQTTDLQVAPRGGNPQVRTATPQLVKPITPTAPAPEVKSQKAEEIVKEDKPEESFEPRKDNRKKLPDVPTKVVRRTNPNAPKIVAKKKNDDGEQRRADETRKQLLNELASAANDLRENTSTSVKFSDFTGPGGDGVPYANFLQAVKSIYTRAWNVPDGVEDDDITTEVSVTIARDGKVVRSEIVKRSGNAAVDHSVRLTLDRVRYVAPLPTTAKEDERTVTIGFNVRAKRGIG